MKLESSMMLFGDFIRRFFSSGGDCCDKHGGTINGGSGPMPTGGGCFKQNFNWRS